MSVVDPFENLDPTKGAGQGLGESSPSNSPGGGDNGGDPGTPVDPPDPNSLTKMVLTALEANVALEQRPRIKRQAESAFLLKVSTFKIDGTGQAPTALEFRVDDLDGKNRIQDWTTVNSPSAETEFLVQAALLMIQDSANSTEDRQITVRANEGQVDEQNAVLIVHLEKQIAY